VKKALSYKCYDELLYISRVFKAPPNKLFKDFKFKTFINNVKGCLSLKNYKETLKSKSSSFFIKTLKKHKCGTSFGGVLLCL